MASVLRPVTTHETLRMFFALLAANNLIFKGAAVKNARISVCAIHTIYFRVVLARPMSLKLWLFFFIASYTADGPRSVSTADHDNSQLPAITAKRLHPAMCTCTLML